MMRAIERGRFRPLKRRRGDPAGQNSPRAPAVLLEVVCAGCRADACQQVGPRRSEKKKKRNGK